MMQQNTAAGQIATRRCLIADDVRGSRELISRWMTQLGFVSSIASDGQSAWQWIQTNHCDLLITDLEMPGMSGLELLQKLRADGEQQVREIPAIVVTSLLDQQVGDVVQRFGGTTVVLKPLDQILMNHVVERVVRKQPLAQVYDSGQADGRNIAGISPALRALVDRANSD